MNTAYITGTGNTRFGRLEGRGPLDLMAQAATQALADAQCRRGDIDGLLCGYATTLPHLMLSTLFAERFGLRPHYAHGMALGGATGAAMLMLARDLVRVGRCRRVLVVAGENRLSGQARDSAIQTLAQVGDPDFEVPNGASVPAYYALLASRYMAATGLTLDDLAQFAVQMRSNAIGHPDAHLREPITAADVAASKPIATPLRLLDCCPISDGAMAFVVAADPGDDVPVAIVGAGQAHQHQHLSALDDVLASGASAAADRAFAEAGIARSDIDWLGIYDSFTITLAMLLEETGFAPRGQSAAGVRDGSFAPDGRLPLNTHGGLLSFGHCGVAGGMGHAVEAVRQMRSAAAGRQLRPPRHAFVHADGGVLSSHVSLILSRSAT
ncbi:thiolase family protein [Pseudorhodoferax sp. Leaf267]|uniref:thiolase family protein n=1 Tax=Pseudorhodoferax sp. Leaf267 TaxID=1736316 RepID=UPI0006F3E08C|nr:thiolase family protein [Pseudorhodoferax sp. Leaf267]KQP15236.1 thiolase [Pseudorhodoferax sp. Leaf267]